MNSRLQLLACSLLAATSLTSQSRAAIFSANAGRVSLSEADFSGPSMSLLGGTDIEIHGDERNHEGRKNNNHRDLHTGRGPSSGATHGHTDDLTTAELLELLELRADSPFWGPIAFGIAAGIVQERHKDWELDANNTNDAAKLAPSSLMQVNVALADLHQEHALVRQAVTKALKPLSFGMVRKDLLRCPSAMSTMRSGEDIHDALPMLKTHNESKAEDSKGQPSKAHVEGETVSTDTVSGTRQNKSALQNLMDSVAKELKTVKQDWDDLTDFFVNFLRWELQVKIFDQGIIDSFAEFDMPVIAFKCQPLFECVKRIASLPGAFIKMMSRLVRVIGKGFKALVGSIARYLGMPFARKPLNQKSVDDKLKDADVEIKIDLPAARQGNGEDQHKLSHFHVPNSMLFDDYARTAAQCQICQGRLKGFFDFKGSNIISTFTGFSSILKLFVTTVPQPMTRMLTNCLGCLRHHKDVLIDRFSNKSLSVTRRYFRSGQCNAHTVGLCMILEKTRACGVSLNASESTVITMDDSGVKSGHNAQKRICNVFKGVTLRLTQAGHRGIRCPERDRQHTLRRKGSLLHFDEQNVSSLDFHMGCHMVRKSMMNFNKACERDPDSGTDPRSKLRRAFADLTGNFTYEHVREPFSIKDVADKCRSIFDCRDHSGSQSRSPLDKRVNWNQLQSSIRGIVSQVDDFQGKPQSYQPHEATTEIIYLVENAMNSLDQFQNDVTEKVAAYETDTEWGPSFENVFLSSLWDDRCFEGLPPNDSQRDAFANQAHKALGFGASPNTEALKAVHARLTSTLEPIKEGLSLHDAHRYDFFNQFSSVLGHRRWSEDKRCELDWTQAKNPIQNSSKHRPPGAKIDLLVLTNISRWKQNWDIGIIDMETFEFSAGKGLRHIELVRVGRDGCMGSACTEGDWYLKSCMGSSCHGAEKGAVLVKMTIKGSQNDAVSAYLASSKHFLATMEQMESLLLNGGDEAGKRGLPSAGNEAFQKALKLLNSWREDACSQLTLNAFKEAWKIPGADVEVRNHESEWTAGKVASIAPLLVDYVNEDGQRMRDQFLQVRPKQTPFKIGDMVQVRDSNDKSWRDGRVASVQPLKVREEHRLVAEFYHQVRHKVDCSHGKLWQHEGGSDLFESFELVKLQMVVEESDDLKEFFKTRRWSLQDAGTDKVTGKQLFRFRRSEHPVKGLDELDDIIRLTKRPHLDAQRSVRSGITEVGFDLIEKAPETILHEKSIPNATQPQIIPQENPFNSLQNQVDGFSEGTDGLARLELEFLNLDEQHRLGVYDKAFKLVHDTDATSLRQSQLQQQLPPQLPHANALSTVSSNTTATTALASSSTTTTGAINGVTQSMVAPSTSAPTSLPSSKAAWNTTAAVPPIDVENANSAAAAMNKVMQSTAARLTATPNDGSSRRRRRSELGPRL